MKTIREMFTVAFEAFITLLQIIDSGLSYHFLVRLSIFTIILEGIAVFAFLGEEYSLYFYFSFFALALLFSWIYRTLVFFATIMIASAFEENIPEER